MTEWERKALDFAGQVYGFIGIFEKGEQESAFDKPCYIIGIAKDKGKDLSYHLEALYPDGTVKVGLLGSYFSEAFKYWDSITKADNAKAADWIKRYVNR